MIQRFITIVILALILLSCRKSDYLLDTGMYSIRDYGQGTGTVTVKITGSMDGLC